MVDNAGIVVGGPVESAGSDDWRKVLEVNLIGQLAVTRAVLPKLRDGNLPTPARDWVLRKFSSQS